MQNKKNPLVTVAIITYNSEKYVLETLDSVAQQTYDNIELIISDDSSADNTLEICQKWIKENRNRFKRTELLTVAENTGISANSNRATRAAHGEWLKTIAGDDALLPNCIEDNILWVLEHPKVKVLFSRIEVYKDTFLPHNFIKATPGVPISSRSILTENRSVNSQYKMLLLSDRIHFTPSVFLNREVKVAIGGLDERFKLLEDYPFWLNLTRNGNKLYFMNKITVRYRQHSNAVNNTGKNFLVNPNFFKSEKFRRLYTYPYLPMDIRLNQHFQWYVLQIYRFDYINKNSLINRFFYTVITSYLNPFKFFISFKTLIFKDLKNNEFYM